ncbi:MAG: LytTR family DNA-binding domain-containing protein [Lachnospiraceae bacterium]|nr:LytTR family DNA-binding domain-containing protein [Lachnospiraceae bacterium]
MLHVGICDDNQNTRMTVKETVLNVLFEYGDVEFSLFSSGDELIDAVEDGDFNCELLFLDINMPGISGLEVAKRLRELGTDVDIIFLTVSKEYVFEGYTYRAFSYLLKSSGIKRFKEEVLRYISEKSELSNCLHVTVNNRKERIMLNRVYYFEGEGRKVNIYQSTNEEMSFYAKMGDLETMLTDFGFIRCHQSYLVNMKYITSFTKSELVVNGIPIPISRRYQDVVSAKLS